MTECRIGLALGSGVARGWAHIGVLRALAKADIHPDVVVGTSIGAVVGGCYVADELDTLEAFARSLTRRKILGLLDFNFAGSGLINGQRLSIALEEHLKDVDIETFARRFVAVATEIGTGHEVWLSRGPMVQAMRASYAIPGIFKPVKLNGRWLFDGALVNPVPVSVARALGARYVIAVNLSTDLSGRGSTSPVADATPATAGAMELVPSGGTTDGTNVLVRNGRAMKKMLQRQLFGQPDTTPGISAVMTEAFNIVQDRIARSRLAGDPPDAVIAPRLGEFGLFDFQRADEIIDLGRRATERVLDDIVREIDARRLYSGPRVVHA
jgi:NTE family protein